MNGAVPTERCDVAILGGGIAGQTLALQIKRARPNTSVIVVERQEHPVPEAAHKVGESSVEISGHYLRDVLGLEEHLTTYQLPKFGLRMFFSAGDNRDITRRVEFGHSSSPPSSVGTYQIDRGRFENLIGSELPERGVPFLHGCKVEEVSLRPDEDTHLVRVAGPGGEGEVQARWVVDATGRRGLLKRQLGLAKKNGHHANAVWFRIAHPIDIEDWSSDPEWAARIREGRRELSTNHLMGTGYWVWLIRLASDSISIGIVADPRYHPFEKMRSLELALEWLRQHEPQCAEVVERYRSEIRDFRVMNDYSYSCEQVYSGDRWCLTGEAGVSLDPLYSPGGDLIAISNGLVTDLLCRDLDGEPVDEQAIIHNNLFLTLSSSWLSIYEDQYPLMGSAQVMVAKVIWDTAVYWAVPGLLYFHDKYRTFLDSPAIAAGLVRFALINEHVQTFLRDWHTVDHRTPPSAFVRYYDFDFMARLQIGMTAKLSEAELEAQFTANVDFVERLAAVLIATVVEDLEASPEVDAADRLRRWREDPYLQQLLEAEARREGESPIDGRWVTLGRSLPAWVEVAT